jgi:perosamine synthetase
MTNIQAAIGVAQMEQIGGFIEKKRQNAALYNLLLENISGITFPPEAHKCKNVFWMYSVLIEDDFGVPRDDVMQHLYNNGIDTRPFFYPLNQLPMYNNNESFPVAEELSCRGINLPSATKLTEEDIKKICSALYSIKG